LDLKCPDGKKWLGDKGPQFRPVVNEYAPLHYVGKGAMLVIPGFIKRVLSR